MPGLFDFVGDLFGGGGDDTSNLFGDFGGGSTDFGSNPFAGVDFTGSDPSSLFGSSNLFGGGGGDTPIPLQTAPTTPAQAGLVNTAAPITGATAPGGASNPFQLPPALMQTLTGIAGGGPGGGAAVTQTGTPTAGGATAGTGNTGTSGLLGNAPGGGVLGSGLTLAQLLGAGGLGATLLQGPGTPPGSDQLTAEAKNNEDLLNNSILPTALANQQGQINGTALTQFEQDLAKKQASIRQSYAGMGESGSTMEAQDLNGARDSTTQAIFTSAQQMATSGLQYAGQLQSIDTGIYNDLMQAQIAQDKEYRDALAAFAAAAGGTTQQAAAATTVAGG